VRVFPPARRLLFVGVNTRIEVVQVSFSPTPSRCLRPDFRTSRARVTVPALLPARSYSLFTQLPSPALPDCKEIPRTANFSFSSAVHTVRNPRRPFFFERYPFTPSSLSHSSSAPFLCLSKQSSSHESSEILFPCVFSLL